MAEVSESSEYSNVAQKWNPSEEMRGEMRGERRGSKDPHALTHKSMRMMPITSETRNKNNSSKIYMHRAKITHRWVFMVN